MRDHYNTFVSCFGAPLPHETRSQEDAFFDNLYFVLKHDRYELDLCYGAMQEDASIRVRSDGQFLGEYIINDMQVEIPVQNAAGWRMKLSNPLVSFTIDYQPKRSLNFESRSVDPKPA